MPKDDRFERTDYSRIVDLGFAVRAEVKCMLESYSLTEIIDEVENRDMS